MQKAGSVEIEQQCKNLQTALEEHALMCHTLFEALAQGSITEEMETEATKAIERATHMALQLIRDPSNAELNRTRQVLSLFKTHCEMWDVVNEEDLSPANDLFTLFKG